MRSFLASLERAGNLRKQQWSERKKGASTLFMTVPFFKLRQFRSNKCCPTHSKQLHPDLAIFTEYIDRRCIRYLISADVYRPTNGAVRLRITLTIVYLPAGKQKSCQGELMAYVICVRQILGALLLIFSPV